MNDPGIVSRFLPQLSTLAPNHRVFMTSRCLLDTVRFVCRIIIVSAFLLIPSSEQTRPGKTRMCWWDFIFRIITVETFSQRYTPQCWQGCECEEEKLPEKADMIPGSLLSLVLTHTHTHESVPAAVGVLTFSLPAAPFYHFLPVWICESFSSLFGFIVYSCCFLSDHCVPWLISRHW